MISVIIPAYNEAAIIERTLTAFLQQKASVPFEVILVANGCSDGTAEIAKGLLDTASDRGIDLKILDLPEGGKVNALNRGDEIAQFEQRIYCDADIIVDDNLVDVTAKELENTSEPIYLSFNFVPVESRSFFTRAYTRMWCRLPYVEKMPHGCGVYAVNKAGLEQRGKYPQVVGDDRFARLSFQPAQRKRNFDVSYLVSMPEGLSELLSVRKRWARGNEEVASLFPALMENEDQGNRYEGFAQKALKHPIDFGVFLLVYLIGAVQGKLNASKGNATWERASKSREKA